MVFDWPSYKLDKILIEYPRDIFCSTRKAINRRFKNLFSKDLSFRLKIAVESKKRYKSEYAIDKLKDHSKYEYDKGKYSFHYA